MLKFWIHLRRMHTPDKANNSIETNLDANIGLEMSIVS